MSLFSDKLCDGLTEASEIVKTLKSSPIKKIVRAYNSATLERIVKDYNPERRSIFNLISGTLLLYLQNNDIVGFHLEDMKESIVAWDELHQGVQNDECYYLRDLCSYMNHDDFNYSYKDNWRHIINESIKSIKVLVYVEEGDRAEFIDSCQKGIIFETDRGHMVISSGLDKSPIPAPFALCLKSDIPPEIWEKAKIIEV